MRGKRLIAPLMAILLITAGIGGVGVPDRVDPVQEGEAIAPVVAAGAGAGAVIAGVAGAAIEAEFGFLGGDDGDVEGRTINEINESVDTTTNVEAHAEHDDLRGHAEYQQELFDQQRTSLNNSLNHSKTVAIGDAKAVLLSEYEDNKTESEAVSAAENATKDYYRSLIVNYLRGVATKTRGAVQANNAYCAHPDFNDGDGCSDDQTPAGLDFNAVWERPDTTYQVRYEIYGENRTFIVAGNKSSSRAFAPHAPNVADVSYPKCVNCSLGVNKVSEWIYTSSHDPGTGTESYTVTVMKAGEGGDPIHQINETQAEAFDNVDAIGANLYSEQPNVSDIDKVAFLGPSTVARRSLKNATNPYAATSLMAGGINSTSTSLDPDAQTAQHLDIYLTEDDQLMEEVALFTNADINFSTDSTYDPANYGAPIYAASLNGSGDIRSLDQPFTVREITGEDGSSLSHVETGPALNRTEMEKGGVDPKQYAAALANMSDRIDRIKQQAGGSGGGGLFGNVGTGIGTPGLIGGGLAIGVIVLLIARPWGA